MIDQLKLVMVCQVVTLLEPARQGAHVLEAFLLEVLNQEPENPPMKLFNLHF